MKISSESIAEDLSERFSGKQIKVSKLLKLIPQTKSLHDAILLLEKKARVYVLREPVLEGDVIRKNIHPKDVVFFNNFPSIKRKSLLYKTGVEYGDYTINHVLGCSHGCKYPCYAMNISKRYGRVKDYNDWMKPKIVENALKLLDHEIPKYKDEIEFVHLSFMTDPFMYDPVNQRIIPWIEELTLSIIKKLNSHKLKCTILTKSKYPPTLADKVYSKENEYGITLVSSDTDFHSQYEPFSPSSSERLDALKVLHDAGLKTWVSLEPYPTPNIVDQKLEDILESIEFVDKIVFGKWNYSSEVNGYKEQKEFYQKCSDKIIEFAGQKEVPFHIKKKTPRSTKETEVIFRE
ncbi:MAG: radical SAM protein [Candidatus Thorarchaeota archaeon]